ncbi:MAG: hypothetical protein JWQ35_673 [Bacteriovoracaceae bacterium]|nr:hypothetical protein [Bacteriovoracaceae bacterium]
MIRSLCNEIFLHLRFGLSEKSFSPRDYYSKCFQYANQVLFFHQGPSELIESLRLIKDLGMGRVSFQTTCFENPWMKRKHPVEVLLWEQT